MDVVEELVTVDAAGSAVGSEAPIAASHGLGVPPVQPWSPTGDANLETEEWQRRVADSAAIRNAVVW